MLNLPCEFGTKISCLLSVLFSILIHITDVMWKILYDDGDVEILRLDKERWKLLDKGRKSTKVSHFL